MRVLAIMAAVVPLAYAQIGDLATSADGSTLLIGSHFRLQREGDARAEAKIYRWREGEWSRLAVAPASGGIVPANVYEPFVAGDGSIFGWQVFPGRGLFPPVQVFPRAEVHGIALPPDFPREYLRVSADGRYWVGSPNLDVPRIGGMPAGGPQWLDVKTGERRAMPEWARMAAPAADGSVAVLRQTPEGGRVSVWQADGGLREIGVFGRVVRIAISTDGRRVAVETEGEDGSRELRVVPEPGGDLPVRGGAKMWSISNARVCYVSSDGKRVRLWEEGAREERTLAEGDELFSEVVLSGDGSMVWAVSETNRLVRIGADTGRVEEILAPLGYSGGMVAGTVVAGSAVQLRGRYTKEQRVAVGGEEWPVSDISPDGYWVQAPWEWRGVAAGASYSMTVRAGSNPFEEVSAIVFDGDYAPYFPQRKREPSPDGSAVIAVHSGFRGLVTGSDPARGGELIHVYMTGLGSLDREVATGLPGPLEAVRPQRPVSCAGPEGSLDVAGAVYAAGLVGIYQVDIRLPKDVPNGVLRIRCGDGALAAGGFLFTRP